MCTSRFCSSAAFTFLTASTARSHSSTDTRLVVLSNPTTKTCLFRYPVAPRWMLHVHDDRKTLFLAFSIARTSSSPRPWALPSALFFFRFGQPLLNNGSANIRSEMRQQRRKRGRASLPPLRIRGCVLFASFTDKPSCRTLLFSPSVTLVGTTCVSG